jgi:hypothetical protein
MCASGRTSGSGLYTPGIWKRVHVAKECVAKTRFRELCDGLICFVAISRASIAAHVAGTCIWSTVQS